MSEKSSYRNIFKATSLFGGVQAIQILLNLIRGKIIAVLLGAAGMGLNTMFTSTITMINNITSLGLNYSAVRDISQSNEAGDNQKLSSTVLIFRRWLYGSAIAGFILVMALSPLLSQYTFKSHDYTLAFIFLSLMLVFNTLSMGNAAVMQGTRNLKKFALYSFTGSLVSLIVSVPLYALWGMKAIVPALIISSFVTYLFSRYYLSGIKMTPVKVPIKETYVKGLDMAKLGVLMLMSTSIGSLVNYLVNSYIISIGSIADLGFYQAGTSIVSQSIGLVFTAMAVDYYPRLAAVCNDRDKTNEMINQQTEIALLIALPILCLIMLTSTIVIHILWTKEYLIINNFIRILCLAMVFKVPGYLIGALLFAKGDKKVFFYVEGIFANFSLLISCVIGYKLDGLNGLAWGYVIMHICYFALVALVTGKRYSFVMNRDLWKQFCIQSFLTSGVFCFIFFLKNIYGYIGGSLVCVVLIVYSFRLLDRMIDIKEFLKKFRRQ
ncbi:Protein wzxE [Bacteroidales bacterium CF]|nr:Protein wzxE [Bacteroidales bacterium CF]